MHDRFRKEFEYVWPKDFVLYYRQRLLPRSGRLGRWALAKLNICENSFLSPHANPQERFFKLVNGFRHWETLSLEQMIRHTFIYYQILIFQRVFNYENKFLQCCSIENQQDTLQNAK